MTYRVLDNRHINRQGSYTEDLQNTLNELERDGYKLVNIEQAVDQEDSVVYIFYREDS
jgi:hypothetical protein